MKRQSKGIVLGVVFFLFLLATTSEAQERTGQSVRGRSSPKISTQELEERFLMRGEMNPEEFIPEEFSRGASKMGVVYQIHIIGQVLRPGTFRVEPSTRLDEALSLAGGVIDLGSRRRVEVRRRDQETRIADLFRFSTEGDLRSNPYLLDNDVIFVPFAEKFVRIEGAIKRNGVLELDREKSLADVLKLAGGTTTDVTDRPLSIVRYDSSGEKHIFEIAREGEALNSFEVNNGDLIYVPNVISGGKKFDLNLEDIPGGRTFYPSSKAEVFVIGSISQPGAYTFNPFNKVKDYIFYAGPNRSANIRGVRVTTAEGKKIERRLIADYTPNPGDVIIVPEKIVTFEKSIAWYNTIASTIITGFTLDALINR